MPASCYAGRGPYTSSSGEFNRAPVSGTELPYARGKTPSLQNEASQGSPTDRGSAEGPHHSTSPLDRSKTTALDKEDLDYSAEDWIAGQLIPSTAGKSRDGAQRNEPRRTGDLLIPHRGQRRSAALRTDSTCRLRKSNSAGELVSAGDPALLGSDDAHTYTACATGSKPSSGGGQSRAQHNLAPNVGLNLQHHSSRRPQEEEEGRHNVGLHSTQRREEEGERQNREESSFKEDVRRKSINNGDEAAGRQRTSQRQSDKHLSAVSYDLVTNVRRSSSEDDRRPSPGSEAPDDRSDRHDEGLRFTDEEQVGSSSSSVLDFEEQARRYHDYAERSVEPLEVDGRETSPGSRAPCSPSRGHQDRGRLSPVQQLCRYFEERSKEAKNEGRSYHPGGARRHHAGRTSDGDKDSTATGIKCGNDRQWSSGAKTDERPNFSVPQAQSTQKRQEEAHNMDGELQPSDWTRTVATSTAHREDTHGIRSNEVDVDRDDRRQLSFEDDQRVSKEVATTEHGQGDRCSLPTINQEERRRETYEVDSSRNFWRNDHRYDDFPSPYVERINREDSRQALVFETYADEVLDNCEQRRRSNHRSEERQSTERTPTHHPLDCLLYTSPSPRDGLLSRMPSSA